MRSRAPIILALAIALTAVAGCKNGDDPTIALPPPSPAAASPSPAATPATVSPAESKVLDAMGFEAGDNAAWILSDAWYICTGDSHGYDDDPTGDVSGPPDAGILEANADDPRYTAAITYLCPEYLPMLRKAQGRMKGSFGDGTYTVGTDIKPGTYRTDGGVTDCYWERSTRSGKTIANDFVSNAPAGVTVTIEPSDGGFKSEGCGTWLRKS